MTLKFNLKILNSIFLYYFFQKENKLFMNYVFVVVFFFNKYKHMNFRSSRFEIINTIQKYKNKERKQT